MKVVALLVIKVVALLVMKAAPLLLIKFLAPPSLVILGLLHLQCQLCHIVTSIFISRYVILGFSCLGFTECFRVFASNYRVFRVRTLPLRLHRTPMGFSLNKHATLTDYSHGND